MSSYAPLSSQNLFRALENPGDLYAQFARYVALAKGVLNPDKTPNWQKVLAEFLGAQKRLVTQRIYHSKALGTAAIVDFFTGSTAGEDTNLDQFTLPQNQPMLVTALRIFEGANADVNKTAWAPGITAADAQNGVLNLSMNNRDMLVRLPLTDFVAAPEDPNAGIVELVQPIVIVDQQAFKASLTFANAISTATENLRIELIGLGLN